MSRRQPVVTSGPGGGPLSTKQMTDAIMRRIKERPHD